jgi:hypothetical protein
MISSRHTQRGFALLITITLLAFLVLLLVSLASLTRVETQVAVNNQDLAHARQQALMALNIAMGQLQEYTGPDQRVTAPANFAGDAGGNELADGAAVQNHLAIDGSNNGLKSVRTGTRWWTGVWSNKDTPNDSFYKTPAPKFEKWLISGNERINQFDPSQATNLSDLANVTINNAKGILLVGPNSAGTVQDDPLARKRYVVAPLVSVTAANLPGLDTTPKTVGRYAWWIGDEGVKAKINVFDSNYAKTNMAAGGADGVLAKNRFRVAARTAPEVISDMDGFPRTNDATRYPQVDKLLETNQLPMMASAGTITAQATTRRIHDFTTHSSGVLSDTLRSGLRRDLTFEFEATDAKFTNGTNSLANMPIIPSGVLKYSNGTGTPDGPWPRYYAGNAFNWGTTPDTTKDYRLKWDALRDWYRLANGTTLQPQPATPTTTGITPVLNVLRLTAGLNINAAGNFSIHIIPLFILANPYAQDMHLSRGLHISVTPDGDGQYMAMGLFTYGASDTPQPLLGQTPFGSLTKKINEKTVPFICLPLIGSWNNGGSGSGPDRPILSNIYFFIPPSIIKAGQAQAFGLDDSPTILPLGAPGSSSTSHPTIPVRLTAVDAVDTTHVINYDTGYNATPPATATHWSIITQGSRTAVHMYEPKSMAGEPYDSTNATHFPTGSVHSAWVGNNYRPAAGLLQLHESRDFAGYNAQRDGNPIATYNSLLRTSDPFAYFTQVEENSLTMSEPIDGATKINDSNGALAPFKDYNIRGTALGRSGVETYGGAGGAVKMERTPLTVEKGYGGFPFSRVNLDDKFNAGLANDPITWGRRFDLKSGPSQVELFDVPRRTRAEEMPLLSIGEFQHASLTADDINMGAGGQPGNAVGNSYFDPRVPRESAVHPTVSTASRLYRSFDISYLYNTTLWDSYIFSAVPPAAAIADGEPVPPSLPNPRLTATADIQPAGIDALRNHGYAAARYLLNDGAFNINSTSLEAWKAVLSANRDLVYHTQSAGTETVGGTPFPRSMRQAHKSVDPSGPFDVFSDNYTSGYRVLSDSQISALASELVKQVRQRGPFVSMAHFINRALAPIADTRSRSGALQSAIDGSGNINNIRQTNEPANYRKMSFGPPMTADAMYPGINDAESNHLSNNRSVGMPGWLTQADVLQSLGPVLSARSDTFVIRAYGESWDVINSTDAAPVVKSRAWCEAVVQRYPDYVDQADPAIHIAGGNDNAKGAVNADGTSTGLSNANQKFGRRYRVVSFRWLNPGDI